jgi:hypothetical protein
MSYLATAIVSPSHELSAGLDEAVRAQLAGVLSPMGDFSHTMTGPSAGGPAGVSSLREIGDTGLAGRAVRPEAPRGHADSENGGQHAESRW